MRAVSPTPSWRAATRSCRTSSVQPRTSSSRSKSPARKRNDRRRMREKRAAGPFFLNFWNERGDGGNHRRHGQGAARQDRCADDGVQEGARRSGRESRQGRGAAANQAGQQGFQGGDAHGG